MKVRISADDRSVCERGYCRGNRLLRTVQESMLKCMDWRTARWRPTTLEILGLARLAQDLR